MPLAKGAKLRGGKEGTEPKFNCTPGSKWDMDERCRPRTRCEIPHLNQKQFVSSTFCQYLCVRMHSALFCSHSHSHAHRPILDAIESGRCQVFKQSWIVALPFLLLSLLSSLWHGLIDDTWVHATESDGNSRSRDFPWESASSFLARPREMNFYFSFSSRNTRLKEKYFRSRLEKWDIHWNFSRKKDIIF